MGATIITTEELREFKMELLDDIRELLQNQTGTKPKKWLKSPEVMQLLGLSASTLQNFRINGTLPFSKIGGVLYYDYDDIQKLLEQNRVHNKY